MALATSVWFCLAFAVVVIISLAQGLSLDATRLVQKRQDRESHGEKLESENVSPDQVKQVRLDYIKWSILQRLNMEGPPPLGNSSTAALLPLAVKNEELELDMPPTKRQKQKFILLANDISDQCRRKQRNPTAHCMRFHLHDVQTVPEAHTLSAVLHVFRRTGHLADKADDTFPLMDYPLKKLDKHLHPRELLGFPERERSGGRRRAKSSPPVVESIEGVKGHWMKFKLKHDFQKWLKRQEDGQVDLQTICKHCDTTQPFAYGGDLTPFITVEVEGEVSVTTVGAGARRKKRSSSRSCNDSQRKGGPDSCCMEELVIDFEEIGWNWILHPQRFTANFCRGGCANVRSPYELEANRLRPYNFLVQPHKDAKFSPCCAPLYFLPIEILYKKENDVIVRTTLENMVVGECGCF